jgi:hypothetical protein
MTSTNEGTRLGGYRREADRQKLGPALLIALNLVLCNQNDTMDPDS